MQQLLREGGYFTYAENTSYFGPLTQSAVQSFQAAHGIVFEGAPETTGFGRVGPQTRAALEALSAPGYSFEDIPVFTRDLSLGMRGRDVRLLQGFLNGRGFLLAHEGSGSPGQETAYFGPLTHAALIEYQAVHGITPAVGFFGPSTRAAANGTIAERLTEEQLFTLDRDLSFGMEGDDVRTLQRFLRARGYFTYPEITGYFGRFTERAVHAFQRTHGIEPTGNVASRTREQVAFTVAETQTETSTPVAGEERVVPDPRSPGEGWTPGFGAGSARVVSPAEPTISLSSLSVVETADIADLVGTLSVTGGTGTYTFTLTNDAGGLFAIVGDKVQVVDALSFPDMHEITVAANNGTDPVLTAKFTITVIVTPLSISGAPVTSASAELSYDAFTVQASGGIAPYTFSLLSGTLPPGITLNTETGLVSGTPMQAGVFSDIVIRVTDSHPGT